MTLPNQVNINIPQLFKDVYGIYARFPIYVLGDKKPSAEPAPVKQEDWNLDQYLIAANEQMSSVGSPYGVPLFDRFQFADPDTDRNNPIFSLPVATVVEVSNNKTIVKTARVGKKGTVKELMTSGDELVTFKGFIINFDKPNAYPAAEVKALKNWFELNVSVPIISKLLNDVYGINNIVFESMKCDAMEGYANAQPFELIGYSDQDIILEIP
jgi:hypothetical protein